MTQVYVLGYHAGICGVFKDKSLVDAMKKEYNEIKFYVANFMSTSSDTNFIWCIYLRDSEYPIFVGDRETALKVQSKYAQFGFVDLDDVDYYRLPLDVVRDDIITRLNSCVEAIRKYPILNPQLPEITVDLVTRKTHKLEHEISHELEEIAVNDLIIDDISITNAELKTD